MPKNITLGEAQQAITGRIERSLKKPTAEERDYQHRWNAIEFGKRCRQLEEENEALKDRLQALDLWDATSKLKISDLEQEIEALKHKIIELKSACLIQAKEKDSMEESVVELVAEKVRLQGKLFYLKLDNDYQTNEIVAMHEEIIRIRREKDLAVEKVFELGANCRRKDEVIVALSCKNQEFFDKILWAVSQLDFVEWAYIDQWMVEKMFEALVGKKTELNDIKVLLDSVREKIGEISEEMMTGIGLPK